MLRRPLPASLKGVAYGSLGELIVQNLVAVSNFTS
jgi:hypothetical protein